MAQEFTYTSHIKTSQLYTHTLTPTPRFYDLCTSCFNKHIKRCRWDTLLLLIMQNCQRSGGAGLVIHDRITPGGAELWDSSDPPTHPQLSVSIALSQMHTLKHWCNYHMYSGPVKVVQNDFGFVQPSIRPSKYSNHLWIPFKWLPVLLLFLFAKTGNAVSNSHPLPKLFLDRLQFSPHYTIIAVAVLYVRLDDAIRLHFPCCGRHIPFVAYFV